MWLITVIAVLGGFVFGWTLQAGVPRHVWDHDSIALGYWIATTQRPADKALDDWMDEEQPDIRLLSRASTWITYQKVTDDPT